jgi:hypothetical protein
MIRCWKTEICCVRSLHLRNIVERYRPPHSLHKFLCWFCHWRITLSSIYLYNKTFFIILLFHDYRILHNPRPIFAIPMSRFCLKEIWSAYLEGKCLQQWQKCAPLGLWMDFWSSENCANRLIVYMLTWLSSFLTANTVSIETFPGSVTYVSVMQHVLYQVSSFQSIRNSANNSDLEFVVRPLCSWLVQFFVCLRGNRQCWRLYASGQLVPVLLGRYLEITPSPAEMSLVKHDRCTTPSPLYTPHPTQFSLWPIFYCRHPMRFLDMVPFHNLNRTCVPWPTKQ